MSIICTEVTDPGSIQRAAYPGTPSFVRATIDPAQSPFPNDYKYTSCFLPRKYIDFAERYYNFEVREDDVWVVTFPKSGTTWVQNVVNQLQNSTENIVSPLDMYMDIAIVYETTENDEHFQNVINDTDRQLDLIAAAPSPRIIKTHLPAYLLPWQLWTVKPKIIYMARNPKDVIVSSFHMFSSTSGAYSGSLSDICDIFINDLHMFSPFHEHVLSFWQLKSLDHVLFMTYEAMLADQFSNVKRINDFLGYSHNDNRLRQITEMVSFDKMKNKIFMQPFTKEVEGKPAFRFKSFI